MIEDKELRELFKIESEEHLQSLDEKILGLEKNSEDPRPLEEVLREIHSIKGSARMVGVKEIEMVAHQLEDMLGRVKRKETGISPEMIDHLYYGIDSIRKLLEQAVSGKTADVDVVNLIEQLNKKGLIYKKRVDGFARFPARFCAMQTRLNWSNGSPPRCATFPARSCLKLPENPLPLRWRILLIFLPLA